MLNVETLTIFTAQENAPGPKQVYINIKSPASDQWTTKKSAPPHGTPHSPPRKWAWKHQPFFFEKIQQLYTIVHNCTQLYLHPMFSSMFFHQTKNWESIPPTCFHRKSWNENRGRSFSMILNLYTVTVFLLINCLVEEFLVPSIVR